MNTPNFPQVAADIRDENSIEARNRQACDNAAALASTCVDPQINLAANLIRQQYIGTHEALVLLHAIRSVRRIDFDPQPASELDWLCSCLADEVIDIAQAHGERDPDAVNDQRRDDELENRK